MIDDDDDENEDDDLRTSSLLPLQLVIAPGPRIDDDTSIATERSAEVS